MLSQAHQMPVKLDQPQIPCLRRQRFDLSFYISGFLSFIYVSVLFILNPIKTGVANRLCVDLVVCRNLESLRSVPISCDRQGFGESAIASQEV